ncbi:MAG: hypothetical protein IPL39_01460 [Opitutaceae bacterium]|nr:hypothetical protein [Opitutaceae bacterium]
MKLHIETTGVSSRSVIVTGEASDLREVSDWLRGAAESGEEKPKEAMPSCAFATHGPYDSLEFRVTKSVDDLFVIQKKKSKWVLLAIGLFWAALLGILYLAYLGLRSLLT